MPAGSITAAMAIFLFCLPVAIAIALYPPPFSPLKNWMSDLGNSSLNPSGSAYFNGACVMVGLLTVVFYLGTYRWHSPGIRGNRMLAAAMASGVFAGIALAGVGIFPETFSPHHFIVSVLFFVANSIAILLANTALKGREGYGRGATCAGYLVIAVSVVFAAQMIIVKSITILEWISVLSMLLWAALTGWGMYHAAGRR